MKELSGNFDFNDENSCHSITEHGVVPNHFDALNVVLTSCGFKFTALNLNYFIELWQGIPIAYLCDEVHEEFLQCYFHNRDGCVNVHV